MRYPEFMPVDVFNLTESQSKASVSALSQLNSEEEFPFRTTGSPIRSLQGDTNQERSNANPAKPRIILLLIRLRCSCLETRSLLSVIWLFLSLTGGTRCAQTPPVGRSEKARRHSPELQWSPNTTTFDLRYHCMENVV